jgi:hypothetical protein
MARNVAEGVGVRFILFKGQSQYGSVRLHVDQLAAALIELGHPTEILDLMEPDPLARLNQSYRAPPDCYLGFSGVGSDARSGSDSVYDQLGVTYASLYVDHPVHHSGRLQSKIGKHVALFLDRSHVQFMSAWPGPRLSQLGFLPPGANTLPDPLDTSDQAFAQRDIPLLFTGSYRGPPGRPWRDGPDSDAKTVIDAVADRMAADARLPVLDALRGALRATFKAELTPALLDDIVPLLQAPQAFSEAYHRDRLLQQLGEAGVPLHIYGAGWEPLVERFGSFRYGGVGSFAETLHLLRRTRLVLNINNGFVAGGHERVFTAMSGGAAVFSDDSRYYASAFKSGREILTFPWTKLDQVPDRLTAALADETALAAVARAGAERALAEHSWSARAADLVKIIKRAG